MSSSPADEGRAVGGAGLRGQKTLGSGEDEGDVDAMPFLAEGAGGLQAAGVQGHLTTMLSWRLAQWRPFANHPLGSVATTSAETDHR